MAPVIVRPPAGPVVGVPTGVPAGRANVPTSGNPLGGYGGQPGVNPVSPPINGGGAGIGPFNAGGGYPSQPSGQPGPASIPQLLGKPLFEPVREPMSPQDLIDWGKKNFPEVPSWFPGAPQKNPLPSDGRNPNENLGPGQKPRTDPGRDPKKSRLLPPSSPTYGKPGQYVRVRYRFRTWDGVTGDSFIGGEAPFSGLAYRQTTTGQRQVGMIFKDGYIEWFALDPTKGGKGENYDSTYTITGVDQWQDPNQPIPQNRVPGPQIIPGPPEAPPAPATPAPYNDPKPFRRPARPPQPVPVAPPTRPPAEPPSTVPPTNPPREAPPERKVPGPVSPPSPSPSTPGPATTPDPGITPRPSPAPRPQPSGPPSIPGTPGPSTVPSSPPTPTPLSSPSPQPLPRSLPDLVPQSTPGRATPSDDPLRSPATAPGMPPLGPPGPGVMVGEPNFFDRYGRPGEQYPRIPAPIPPISLPPNLDCCDLNSIEAYLRLLKDYIANRFDDVEDCACPVTATTTTLELVSSTNNGNYALPANTVAVRFRMLSPDGNMRTEWGGGNALNVSYLGWYSTSMFSLFGGKRTQIQYDNQVAEVRPGDRFLSVTAKGATQIAVDAVVMSGFRDHKGFSVPSAVRGSERLYQG